MAQDVFGKVIRPGDICLRFDNASMSYLIVAEIIKPKTVNGIRSIGVMVITEEQARLHRINDNNEYRLPEIEGVIQESRELKIKFGIED